MKLVIRRISKANRKAIARTAEREWRQFNKDAGYKFMQRSSFIAAYDGKTGK